MECVKEVQMKFIGIDLHSNGFTCCFISDDDKKFKKTFPVSIAGIDDFLGYVDSESYVIIEASTNT
jgi:hypothetical protein